MSGSALKNFLVSVVGFQRFVAGMLVVVMLVQSPAVAAPVPYWTVQFGTSQSEIIFDLCIDPFGNIVVAGEISGAFSGHTNAGMNDAFFRIYTSGGTVSSTIQFGTDGYDAIRGVTCDSGGNIIVVGETGGNLGGVFAGNADAFVRKHSAAGNLIWMDQFGTSSNDKLWNVETDSSGNVYVVGYTAGVITGTTSAGGSDVLVRKYTANGTALWTDQFGSSSSDYGYGIALDSSGNVYITGNAGGALPDQTAKGASDGFVRKYLSDGTVIWTRQFGTPSPDNAYNIAVDNSLVYIVGYTTGTFVSNSGENDVFIRMYTLDGADGTTLQFGSITHDFALAVAVDSSGNIYVGGSTFGVLGKKTFGARDAFIRKYVYTAPATYAEEWTYQIGTSGAEELFGLAVDSKGIVYAGGYTSGTLPGQITSGSNDSFLMRLVGGLSIVPKISRIGTGGW